MPFRGGGPLAPPSWPLRGPTSFPCALHKGSNYSRSNVLTNAQLRRWLLPRYSASRWARHLPGPASVSDREQIRNISSAVVATAAAARIPPPAAISSVCRHSPGAPAGTAVPTRGVAGATQATLATTRPAVAAATEIYGEPASLDVSLFLKPLLAATRGGTKPLADAASVREAAAAFAAAADTAEKGEQPFFYIYDITDPVYCRVLRPAKPSTPGGAAAAAAAAASASPFWQQHHQQRLWKHFGSPFYVVLLQALHAATSARMPFATSALELSQAETAATAALAPATTRRLGGLPICSRRRSIETAVAEVAAVWQLQVARDLRRLRRTAEFLQQDGGASTATAAASAAAAATPLALHQEQLETLSAALFCSAAEAVALLAEMQMKPSVRDAVPTLLLALERLRLSDQLRRCQPQRLQQEQQKVLNSDTRGSLATPLVTEKAAAIAAAEAAVRCLHALGRCQLFSEKLLEEVSAHHIAAADADTLALYLFECGRMGLRCKRWIDGCFERALAAVQEMSGASLLLACAGLYRFCTDWKPFYERAAPRLLLLLTSMDFYQLRLMLRLCKHLNPALSDPQLTLLSREAAVLLTSTVPSLDLQQLCCIATFVERRSPNTPAEYGDLTRALVAAIEASAPPLPLAASGRASEEAGAGAAGAEGVAGDPLSLVHPLHDLVDLVDCVASHGLQSSVVRRVEAVVAARYTEIEYSVNFTLWLVCLDAFSRVKGHYPHMLLQHITANMCKAVDNSGGSSTWAYKSSSNGSLSSPLDSLSALQRLKFMQALTRLSFFPLPVVQLWCSSVEGEPNLLRSLRDAVTCVFPLSLAVYIHPVLFSRAFRFVERRYCRETTRSSLAPSDRHLEPLFLSHLCWAFLVAEMHRRPFFVTLLDRALALSPCFAAQVSPEAGCWEELAAQKDHCTYDSDAVTPYFTSRGAAPWRLQDVAAVDAQLSKSRHGAAAGSDCVGADAMMGSGVAADDCTTATGASAAVSTQPVAWCPVAFMTALDCITYCSHCEPAVLLQQVCRLLQLEAPQLAAAGKQQQTFRAHAEAVVQWKGDRQPELRQLLEEVREVATEAGLEWREAREGLPPSPVSAFGSKWPFSEVCLWVQGYPLVLQADAEGFRVAAQPPEAHRNFNTGHKYLLLRGFRAMGVLRVIFIDAHEWRRARETQQHVSLLRNKFAV